MLQSVLTLCLVVAGATEPNGLNQRCGFHCRMAHRVEHLPVSRVIDGKASVLKEVSLLSMRSSTRRVGEGDEELVAWVAPDDGEVSVRGSVGKADLLALGSKITKETYGKALHRLVDRQTSRFVGNAGNKQAADFIQKVFGEQGLETFQQTLREAGSGENQYIGSVTPGGNVLAYLEGSDPKLRHEVIVLASHYDSVNWKDTSKDAPGVDDNGSGTALVMLAAQTLAKSSIKPKRSILFATFNAEEEGLLGSANFVRKLKSSSSFLEAVGSSKQSKISAIKKEHIKAALIVDEVAWPGRGDTKNGAIFETRGPNADTSALVNTLAYTAKLKDDGDGVSNFVVNWKGFGSDHISFLDGDIPAVLLIERDDEYHADTWGHSDQDVFDHVDLEYGAAMTRLAIRTVMRLASPE